jgi:hypothetical protein
VVAVGSPLPSPPSLEVLSLAVLMYLAGLVTPWYYALERMRGFGRWAVNWLPYAPPPGEESGQALEQAVEAGERTPDADDSPGS